MPNLKIIPELGDSIYDCFENAYKSICADNTLRTASFTHNGLEVTIKPTTPKEQER